MRKTPLLVVATWLCFVIFHMFSAIAAGETREWRFANDPVGQVADGFSDEMGVWLVVEVVGNRVFAQTAQNPDDRFNLALVTDTNAKDVDVSVSMTAIAGKLDQGGGLVWRAKDAKNYYLARYNPLENNYRVYKIVDGRRTQLASADVQRSPGPHTLRVTMKGQHIECYFDGKKYLDHRDGSLSEAGKIGLWTKADAQSQFDDLKLIAD